MFAVMVQRGWDGGHRRFRPFLIEVTRDRPKTLFSKTNWGGENRYRKADYKYQTFDQKDDAEALLREVRDECGVTAADEAEAKAKSLREAADTAVETRIENW